MEAFHVVAAGGIGCAVGHALVSAGLPVTLVETDPAKLAWGRQHGIGIEGQRPAPASFVAFADWAPPPGTTVLLCTKCYDNAAVLARMPASVMVLPIQNGFDPQLDARAPHPEGIASFVSECLPGQTWTRLTRMGQLYLGINPGPHLVSGDLEEDFARALARLAGALSHAPFPVKVVPDIRPYKYTKLMYNAALSPLAAAAGLDNGEVLRRPRIRALFFALLRENHAILSQAGRPLGKVGPLHPATVARILARPWLAHALAWAFYPSLRGSYCSMFNDLPRGRTEVEHYNGYLIALAGDRPCPLNRAVYALLKGMEMERIPPHPGALDAVLSAFERSGGRTLAAIGG
jgi:2-dehydropantoate 2-reductase